MTLRPRLLPSVIFAAGALLALRVGDLWTDGGAVATALAQTKAGDAPTPDVAPADKPAAATPPSAAPSAPAPAEAPSPAPPPTKSAQDPLQMSPEQIDELQQLAARRVELDKRAAELSEREVLMEAAEKRIDEKIAKLQTLQKTIESDVKVKDDQEDARVQSLAHMYEQMKPADAARILDQLDVPVILTLLSHMRELKASPILATMDPTKAKSVTLALTEQRDPSAKSAE